MDFSIDKITPDNPMKAINIKRVAAYPSYIESITIAAALQSNGTEHTQETYNFVDSETVGALDDIKLTNIPVGICKFTGTAENANPESAKTVVVTATEIGAFPSIIPNPEVRYNAISAKLIEKQPLFVIMDALKENVNIQKDASKNSVSILFEAKNYRLQGITLGKEHEVFHVVIKDDTDKEIFRFGTDGTMLKEDAYILNNSSLVSESLKTYTIELYHGYEEKPSLTKTFTIQNGKIGTIIATLDNVTVSQSIIVVTFEDYENKNVDI